MSELAVSDAGADVRERSRWRDAARRFTANRAALVGSAGLAFLVASCLLVPALSPHDPYDAQYEIILVFGLVYGAVAGFAGGRLDELMMGLLDGLFAVQRLPAWQNDYVRAAVGATREQILVRHLSPTPLGVLVVAVLLELPVIILGQAFLSLLGLGLNAPRATWGNIAQDGLYYASPYLMLLPSLAIAWFAVCTNFVADGVHDALDPRRGGVPGGTAVERAARAAA